MAEEAEATSALSCEEDGLTTADWALDGLGVLEAEPWDETWAAADDDSGGGGEGGAGLFEGGPEAEVTGAGRLVAALTGTVVSCEGFDVGGAAELAGGESDEGAALTGSIVDGVGTSASELSAGAGAGAGRPLPAIAVEITAEELNGRHI